MPEMGVEVRIFSSALDKTRVFVVHRRKPFFRAQCGQVTLLGFLTFVRCSLAGQTKEEEYLVAVAKGYTKGKKGKRGVDKIVIAFAKLVEPCGSGRTPPITIYLAVTKCWRIIARLEFRSYLDSQNLEVSIL